MHKLKIIIAIEYPLVVTVLKDIAINKGLEIAAVCDNNKETYQQIIKHKPDIAILGICSVRMNAIKVIEKLATELCPQTVSSIQSKTTVINQQMA